MGNIIYISFTKKVLNTDPEYQQSGGKRIPGINEGAVQNIGQQNIKIYTNYIINTYSLL